MKLLLSFLFILLISSCGKKGEGSNPGVSPLLPAPVSVPTSTQTPVPEAKTNELELNDTDEVQLVMLEEIGIRIERSKNLINNPAVIICINTNFSHEEKIEGLKNYFITINDEVVHTRLPKEVLNSLIDRAVEILSAEPADSKKCPKIFLAIE